MLGAIATYHTSDVPNLYLHGSSVARLFRTASVSSLPVCVAATCIDGYVLALAPFHNSCNYRSAVVYGLADTVEDADEIEFALREITNATVPHRNEESRSKPSKAELLATSVVRVRIESASAKVRTGGPHDDRADLADADLTRRTWTGVVPVYPFLGQPVASETNQVKVVPEYLVDWVEDANSRAEQYAIDAMEDE